MADLVKFAEKELDLIGETDPMRKDLLALVKLFNDQNHSGFSATFSISRLSFLLNFKPLSDLTYKKDEWEKVGHKMYQNKRDFSVFKEYSEERKRWIIYRSTNKGRVTLKEVDKEDDLIEPVVNKE